MSKSLPVGPVVMRQRWESLLFLHWRYPIEVIQETLPPGLNVDTCAGEAYIGVVPFLMRKVRPRFLFSVPGLSNFHELNLRTYVVDEHGRKGVWFYSLDADQPIAVTIARKLFALPYEHARMRYEVDADRWESFFSQRKGSESQVFNYRGRGDSAVSEEGSLCEFLVERYRLFCYNARKDVLYSGEIHHAPYCVSEVDVDEYSKALFELNGLGMPEGGPDHQILAQPVDVDIYPLRRIEHSLKLRAMGETTNVARSFSERYQKSEGSI